MSTRRRRPSAGEKRDWLELPDDLLFLISNRLDPRFDLPKIRAVCKSWRSIIPYVVPPITNSIQIHVAKPISTVLTVEETTLYCVKYHVDSKSKSKPRGGGEFLLRVGDSQRACRYSSLFNPWFSIFNPSYFDRESDVLEPISKGLNLLDCSVYEYKKNYEVHQVGGGRLKAAYSAENSTLLWINREGLVFIRAGEEKLSKIGDIFDYEVDSDVTLYKGNFYAIDKYGKIIVIDPVTMNITLEMNIPSNIHPKYRLSKKLFAQSKDDLYVIGKQRDDRQDEFKGIYRVDESNSTLVSVKRIRDQVVRDQVVFISNDCSFIAPLAGLSGNRTYYVHHTNHHYRVFYGLCQKLPKRLV